MVRKITRDVYKTFLWSNIQYNMIGHKNDNNHYYQSTVSMKWNIKNIPMDRRIISSRRFLLVKEVYTKILSIFNIAKNTIVSKVFKNLFGSLYVIPLLQLSYKIKTKWLYYNTQSLDIFMWLILIYTYEFMFPFSVNMFMFS